MAASAPHRSAPRISISGWPPPPQARADRLHVAGAVTARSPRARDWHPRQKIVLCDSVEPFRLSQARRSLVVSGGIGLRLSTAYLLICGFAVLGFVASSFSQTSRVADYALDGSLCGSAPNAFPKLPIGMK